MPLYTFHCPCCGVYRDVSLPLNDRDTTRVDCDRVDCRACIMTRVPNAPRFKINGYAARNGYAAHVDVSKHGA